MNVLIFGASGMVGQGVLRECLRATDVDLVLTVGRADTAVHHPNVRSLVLPDLMNYQDVESKLQGFDACFFCLGVSAAGLDEAQYTRLTYDLTLAAGSR